MCKQVTFLITPKYSERSQVIWEAVPDGWACCSLCVVRRQSDQWDKKLVIVFGSDRVARWWAVWQRMKTQFRQVVRSSAVKTMIRGHLAIHNRMLSVMSSECKSCFIAWCKSLSYFHVLMTARAVQSLKTAAVCQLKSKRFEFTPEADTLSYVCRCFLCTVTNG